MATSGTAFEIDIPVSAAGVEPAAAAVARLAQELTGSQSAAMQAAEAMRAGEAAYAAAEVTADKAAKAVEKIGLAADAQRGKLQAAMDAGDAAKADRAAAALSRLVERQAEATRKAGSATAAMNAQAVALDALRANASRAADAEVKVAKSFDLAKKSAAEAAKAAAKAAGDGKALDALDGVAKLSGPLGGTVMQLKNASEGFKKLTTSMGSAGPYIAIGAALAAIAVGLAAVTAAAVVGIGKVTRWAVTLSDKEGQIKKDTDRLKKGFDKLFSGLKVDKLTASFGRIVDLFDETNASGRAIKVVFESLFQPIVDGVAAFLPKIRTAFLEFQIMALKALIAIKPYGSTIMLVVKVLGVMGAVLTGVVVVAVGLVVANLAVLAFGIAAIVTVAAALAAGVVWLVAKLGELYASVGTSLVGAFDGALEWLKALDFKQIGADMLQGLVDGILGGGPALLKSMTGVVDGAVKAAKAALGIASPSKVFRGIATNITDTTVDTIEAGSADVRGSLESMVTPPAEAGAAAASTSPATGSAGGDVYNITIQGGDTARANVDAFSEWFERKGAQLGTAVPVG